MLLSNFELLVKPIAPKPFSPSISRRVIQAYFLTISNLNPAGDDVVLSVQFTATAALRTEDTFTIVDAGGSNVFGELSTDNNTGKPSQLLTLPAGSTTLFVLQPDISKPNFLEKADYEVRGYVEVLLSPFSPSPSAELLVSPQSRGTFVPTNLEDPNPDFDQQAYSLLTASGGAFLTL
ncbi:MAG: hypothetical protein KME38_16515 [Spirirestis rafaelensis WJT71-NPBG6]|jgi:hypothetical protein|nr:hypothetical protein [Spirirestis rafaelensis WJT71-NPBG6]